MMFSRKTQNIGFKFKDTYAGLLNKSSYSATALGVTKFITTNAICWSHFVLLLKSNFDV